MAKILKSSVFLRKVALMTAVQQKDVAKAIEHVVADPENDDFKRPYLTPYRQEHLPQDKQYTVYFESRDDGQTVYVVWINDASCLHTTRKPTEDPDVKEFDRLRKAGELEPFDHGFHAGQFIIKPKADKPTFFELKKLGVRVFCNVFQSEDCFCSTGLRVVDDEHGETYDVLRDFLGRLAEYYKATIQSAFEFRLHTAAYEALIEQVKEAIDPAKWQVTEEDDITLFTVL
jgi:hypothetical protein